jgi:hypothetical protein
MHDEAIREHFERFGGKRRYEKFLLEFNLLGRRDGSLQRWQDALLRRFEAELGVTLDRSRDRLVELFGLCPVHRTRLEHGEARVLYGLPDEDGSTRARRKRFPFAKSRVLGGCMLGNERTSAVEFCAACREAEAAWNESRR